MKPLDCFPFPYIDRGPSHVPTSRVFAYETSQQYRVDIRKKASSDISNKLLSILHYGFIK